MCCTVHLLRDTHVAPGPDSARSSVSPSARAVSVRLRRFCTWRKSWAHSAGLEELLPDGRHASQQLLTPREVRALVTVSHCSCSSRNRNGPRKIGLKCDQDKEERARLGLKNCKLSWLCSSGKGFAELLLAGWCHQTGTAPARYLPSLHHVRSSTRSARCWSFTGLEGGQKTPMAATAACVEVFKSQIVAARYR